jgi:DNA-binding transcriptional regulator YiaG
MACPICGDQKAREVQEPYKYEGCGLDYVYLIGILQTECPNCGLTVTIPREHQLLNLIGFELVRREERLGPREIRFLRSMAGWTQQELAGTLRVERGTVTNWECLSDPTSPEKHTEALFRLVWAHEMAKRFCEECGEQMPDQLRRVTDDLLDTISKLIDAIQIQAKSSIKIDVESMQVLQAACDT